MPSSIPLTLTPDSNKVHGYGYDATTRRLAVEFKTHKDTPPAVTYEYINVPVEKFAELEAAESKGKFVNAEFVNTKWPFDKLTKASAAQP